MPTIQEQIDAFEQGLPPELNAEEKREHLRRMGLDSLAGPQFGGPPPTPKGSVARRLFGAASPIADSADDIERNRARAVAGPVARELVGGLPQAALAVLVGAATGGRSFKGRLAAQTAAGMAPGAFEAGMDVTSGEDPRAALTESAAGGLIGAGAEAVASGLPPAVGAAVRGVRGGASAFRDALRRARGLDPLPTIPGLTSTKAPNAAFLKPGGDTAYEVAREVGGVLDPAVVVHGGAVERLTNIAEQSFTGAGGRLTRARDFVKNQVNNKAWRILEAYPKMSEGQAMEVLQGYLHGELKHQKGIAGGLYDKADQMLAPGYSPVTRTTTRTVPHSDPAKAAMGLTEQATNAETVDELTSHFVETADFKKALEKAIGKERLRLLPVENPYKRAYDLPDKVSFKDMQGVRSDLWDLGHQRSLTGPTMSREQAIARSLYGDANKAIEAGFATVTDPAAKETLEAAGQIWRDEVQGKFGDDFILKVLYEQPDKVLQHVVTQGTPTDILRLMKLTDQADPFVQGARANLQGAALGRIMRGATSEVGVWADGKEFRNLSGRALNNELDALAQGRGKEFMDQMFPGADQKVVNNLRRYATTLQVMEDYAAGGSRGNGVAISILQAGAATGLLTGGIYLGTHGREGAGALSGAGTVGVLAGPHVLTRILQSDHYSKWLTTGANSAPGSRMALRATMVLVGGLLREGLISDDQIPVAQKQVQDAAEGLGYPPNAAYNLTTPGKIRMTKEELEAAPHGLPDLDAMRREARREYER